MASSKLNTVVRCITALAVLAVAPQAVAQGTDYPSRRVTIVVPFGAGAPGDLHTRLVAERLEQKWKQPVLVENRPGADGRISYEYVAKAPADGYTLLQGSASHALMHLLIKDLRFDPLKDLTIAAMTGEVVLVLSTSANAPASNWSEFVAWAKANPGKVAYGSLGRQFVTLAIELLSQQAGFKLAEVPYKGVNEITQALLRGDIQLATGAASGNKPFIDSGKMKALFVISESRVPQLPTVPTAAEVGLPNFRPKTFQSIVAPSATPRAVFQKINTDVNAIVNSAEYPAMSEKVGMRPYSASLDEIKKVFDEQVAAWTGIAKALNMKPE